MHSKKDKGSNNQQGHEYKSIVERRVIFLVGIVGMDDIVRKILIGFGMAFLTGFKSSLITGVRFWIIAFLNVMVTVAIVACCHALTA